MTPPPSTHWGLGLQIDKDNRALFHVLLEVPLRVVKYLQQTAQAGYDKLRLEVDSEGNMDEADEMAAVVAQVCTCRG